ncbi:hypothetical protein POM88_022133 [Heracleum sosnowskyi]|uniref:Uncharacterized protein n=1 Tax=Heracleum sosnowskyi TaxID=360622 RepID=A0AAD8IFX5_9APIA|nr:hypothetical protein POM88_022133 [Heracleum sosnowskyi]
MATTAFVSSGLEFVPNNYAAPLNTVNAPEAFHIIQDFLAQSAIGRALVEPAKLYGSQIKAFWETGVYDDGGDSGTPSIVFEFQETEFVITPGTVREAMGFAESNAYTISVGDTDLQRMMQAIGYTGSLAKIGQLSFFFDCITRAFGKKCTNWDAIPIDSLQIGYSLLFASNYDFARLVLMNIGEKLTENRHVVYFYRFCQLLFSACVPNVEIDEEDVIPSFKLHKRVFSDLTNKDLKKVSVGELLLPETVLQFLNPQPQPQQPSEPVNVEASTVQPRTGGRTKHVGTKPPRIADDMPQKKRLKKRRANRAKSDNADEDSEPDDETLHQRKRRLVAAHLFGASNVNTEAVNLDRVFEENVVETASMPEMVSVDKEAPTSKADDVVDEAAHVEIADEAPEIIVQEATENIEAEIFEPQGFDMEVEANISVNSEHFTEGLEADQDTAEIEESMASHTEIISFEFEKGEEVDQTLAANATETVAANPDVADKDATENVTIEAEFVTNSETNKAEQITTKATVENFDEAMAESVPVETEFVANSEIPEPVAEKVIVDAAQSNFATAAEDVPAENTADDNNDDDSSDHSQEELFESQANSDELREVNRATAEHFQDMYYNRWAAADYIFSAQRAADFLGDSVKTISNPDILTSLKATVIQIKSLHNRFDESHKEVTALRNEVGLRDLTLKNDRTYYNSMFKKQAKDSDEIQKRLGKVEDNQTAMSAQLTSISNAIELLTSVLLSDDVKKGESVPSDKCKDTQTLRRRDDGNDGGNKGDGKSLRLNADRRLLSRRSNSERRSNSGKGHANSASGSKFKSLIISDKPTTDEEIAAKVFMAEHGKDVTIEDIQAEEQMLAEEHKKNLEAGIYKKKEIKAPRKKETGISIKENTQQSIQYTRRPVIKNADKGKGILVEEEQLPKKNYSTSDKAQVEVFEAKSTSDKAQVDVIVKDVPTSDNAQVVQTQLSSPLQGFKRSSLSETLKPSQVNFLQTRTVLGKQSYDKSGLGSHQEKRVNNSPLDHTSLAEPGVGVTQENLDKLESVQMIYHRGLKKEFLLYFMADGRVYRIGEDDIRLKFWEELEYVLYLLKIKNRNTHNAALVLKDRMMKSKVLFGGSVSSAYIPKYRDAHGKLVEMKKNSARFRTALDKKVLEFNLESDKAFYIRLGNEMNKNSIYSLRAAIYQIGEDEPELKELKKDMIAELDRAERKLLSDYIRTVPDIQEIQ